MNRSVQAAAFLKHLFDDKRLAAKVAVIVEAIWAACSLIAQHMPGSEAADYKMVQCFLRPAGSQYAHRHSRRRNRDEPFAGLWVRDDMCSRSRQSHR
jgi:hypothetical protein